MNATRLSLGLAAPGAAATYLFDRLAMRPAETLALTLRGRKRRAYPYESEVDGVDATPDLPTPEARRLWDAVSSHEWYHSMNLGLGITTPGQFDHAPFLKHYPVPASLAGRRVLDIATYDGYWAYEFERRGAAQVYALDIAKFGDADLPFSIREAEGAALLERMTGAGFRIAHECLQSKVERKTLSVYNLSEDNFGKFDFVFVSDLLVHLLNPVKALQNIRRVVSGTAVFVGSFNPLLPGTIVRYKGFRNMIWWSYSLGALRQMIQDAGFRRVELYAKFKIGKRHERPWMWQAAFVAEP